MQKMRQKYYFQTSFCFLKKLCMRQKKLYKTYINDVSKMKINCISHFSKPLHTHCIQNYKDYEGWNLHTKCICIHVYLYTCIHIYKYKIYRKIYTKFYQNAVYILCRFCIHFVYVNSDLQILITRTMYTICKQNSYKMHIIHCIQNASHI